MSEDEIHMVLVGLLRRAGISDFDFWHTPNGGRVSPREASRRRARGVNAGVADLIFAGTPMRALELKADRGTTSAAQKEWLARRESEGWIVSVTKGLEAAKKQLIEWGYLPCTTEGND